MIWIAVYLAGVLVTAAVGGACGAIRQSHDLRQYQPALIWPFFWAFCALAGAAELGLWIMRKLSGLPASPEEA